jgi:hypothetical protein
MFVTEVKIGADIEVFLRNKETGEIVSAEGIIPGTKYKPFIFDDSSEFHALSLDNVSPEFCIPPSTSPAEFYFGIEKALKYINSIIPKELETAALPAAYLDEKYLQTENAKLFGCEPDFNAWTEMQNMPPSPTENNMRTGGGHIHIGYKSPNEFINKSLVKALDIFLGAASILQEPDNERKRMYGKAGAYRDKSYGVEYRTISNYYLQSKELTDWVFQNTMEAIKFVNSGKCNMLGIEEKEEIVNCINYNNHDLAKTIVKKYQVKLAA